MYAYESPFTPLPRRPVRETMTLAAASVAAALLAACVSAGGVAPLAEAPARAAAAPAAFARWDGPSRQARWEGSYRGGSTQRGTLALRLEQTATGSVAGEVTWQARPARGVAPGARHGGPVAVRVPLAEAHVAAERVVLVTDAYFDPACGCTVSSTFTGQVRGDTLSGQFVTQGAATAAGARGRWLAVRRASAAAEPARTLAGEGTAGHRRVPAP